MGRIMDPADQVEFDRTLAMVRAQLDEAAFNAAWAEGRKMTLEQAVEYALENLKSTGGYNPQVVESATGDM